MSNVGRRALLRSGVSLAASSGLIGVATASRDSPPGRRSAIDRQDTLPESAGWIPDDEIVFDDDGELGVWSIDIGAFLELPDGEDGEDDEEFDPMFNPVLGLLAAAISWWDLESKGIAEPIVGDAANELEGSASASDVPTSQQVFVGDASVYIGSFDAAAIEAAVEAGDFSETSTSGLYAHADGQFVITWSDEHVITGSSESIVEAIRAAGEGTADRLHESDDDFEWLLRTGGRGDLPLVAYSEEGTVTVDDADEDVEEFDVSMFSGSEGFAQSMSIDVAAERATAVTGVVYADEASVDRDGLESSLGTQATDRSVDQNGRFVAIEATFEDEFEDVPEDGSDDGSDSGDESDDDSDSTDETTGEDDGDEGDGNDGEVDGDDGDDGDDSDGGDEGDDEDSDDEGESESDDDDDEAENGEDEGGEDEDGGDEDGDDGFGGNGADEDGDDSVPAPGILGTIASVGAAGYLLSRRRPFDDDRPN